MDPLKVLRINNVFRQNVGKKTRILFYFYRFLFYRVENHKTIQGIWKDFREPAQTGLPETDPSDGTASRTIIHQQLIEPHRRL